MSYTTVQKVLVASKFRWLFMLKALNCMHLILSYKIRQQVISMEFSKDIVYVSKFSVAPQYSKKN